MKILRSIQYLRGLAALSVVVFHAFQWTHAYRLTATDFPTGAAGVDVFFVISGFVMWTTTDEAAPTPLEFLRRRAVRIFPPYWVFTALAVAGAVWAPRIFQDVVADRRDVILSLFLIPHFDATGDAFPVLKPGWTLIYEALFYLIFAAALPLAKRARFVVIAVTLVTVTAVGFVWDAASVVLANALMLEFLAGAAIAVLWREGRLGSRVRGWSLIALALAGLAVLQAIDYRDYDWRPLFWGVPAVLLVGGAVDIEAAGGAWTSGVLKRLGDASYSIYLCHFLALQPLARLFGVTDPWLFIPEAVIVSVACGLAARQLVEKPTLRWLHGIGRAMPGFETSEVSP